MGIAETVMAKKKICVALQGGGAHGAFTWGVLDRLLEEESLEIQAVSGTSAGAMNGAVMVDALSAAGGSMHASGWNGSGAGSRTRATTFSSRAERFFPPTAPTPTGRRSPSGRMCCP